MYLQSLLVMLLVPKKGWHAHTLLGFVEIKLDNTLTDVQLHEAILKLGLLAALLALMVLKSLTIMPTTTLALWPYYCYLWSW